MDSMNIGDTIRSFRLQKGMSQGDIEKRTGLLRCYLSRVENGHTVPSLDTLSKIAGAMEVGRTSSRLAERGKGLQNLIEFAKAHSFGSLSIYSLRGMYRQVFTNGSEPDDIKRDFQNSIGGTLVEWSVNL